MERLCVRVQQQVCVLKGCEEGEEVQTARQILKEARNSRAVGGLSVFVSLHTSAPPYLSWNYCSFHSITFVTLQIMISHFLMRYSL